MFEKIVDEEFFFSCVFAVEKYIIKNNWYLFFRWTVITVWKDEEIVLYCGFSAEWYVTVNRYRDTCKRYYKLTRLLFEGAFDSYVFSAVMIYSQEKNAS